MLGGVRIALVIASLVLAASAANACPPIEEPCGSATCWHGPIAVAFVAAADQPGLVATIDNAAFGGPDWPERSVGVLVTGASLHYVGPLAGMTSDALRGSAVVGTLDDGFELAAAQLERIDEPRRVIYIVGDVDMATFSRYRERARQSGIETYMWMPAPPQAQLGQYDYVTQVLKKPTPFERHDWPRWPAVALLLAAAALARRLTA